MGGSKDLLHHRHRLLDRYWGFWRPRRRPTDLVPTCNYPIISSILKMTRWLRGPTWGPDGGWEGDGKRAGSPKRFPPPLRGHILYTQLRPPAERYRRRGRLAHASTSSWLPIIMRASFPVCHIFRARQSQPTASGQIDYEVGRCGRSPQLAFVPHSLDRLKSLLNSLQLSWPPRPRPTPS